MTRDAITYTQNAGRVTLEMSVDDYQGLLLLLGLALSTQDLGSEDFYRLISFTNQLNATNPHYTQYAIPEHRAVSLKDSDLMEHDR